MISDDTSMQRGDDNIDATSYSQSEMVRVVEDASDFTETIEQTQKSELRRIGGQ